MPQIVIVTKYGPCIIKATEDPLVFILINDKGESHRILKDEIYDIIESGLSQ